jgi:prepilin-type N-terminal cleavage/methylation domain-containing protein/prepilin-type processing-associated H-X9-DG protein
MRRNQHGFTLTELLVVVAIIGILSSLLFPALGRAKAHAQDASCISNLHQWGVAWKSYTDENNDTFMTGTVTGTRWPRGEWVLYFKNYYSLLLCPKATARRGPGALEVQVAPGAANATEWGGPTTAYDFPIPSTSDPSLPLTASYGLNSWVYNPDEPHVQGRGADYHWRKYTAPPTPSITPLFLDSMWRGGGPDVLDRPPRFNGEEVDQHDEVNAALNEMDSFAIIRHGKGVNLLYFDASVRNTRAKDLWSLPWHREYDVAAASKIVFPAWMN